MPTVRLNLWLVPSDGRGGAVFPAAVAARIGSPIANVHVSEPQLLIEPKTFPPVLPTDPWSKIFKNVPYFAVRMKVQPMLISTKDAVLRCKRVGDSSVPAGFRPMDLGLIYPRTSEVVEQVRELLRRLQ